MKYEIVNVRPYGQPVGSEIAVDILWTHEDGGFIREHVSHAEEENGTVKIVEDASGTSIADMLTFTPPLDEAAVLAAIEAKRPIVEHEVELFRRGQLPPVIEVPVQLIGKKG